MKPRYGKSFAPLVTVAEMPKASGYVGIGLGTDLVISLMSV